MSNVIQPRLQYSYAKVNLQTGLCTSCATTSYEINNPAFILVPAAYNEYVGKYYNFDDGLWYYDQEHTQPFDINTVI